MDAGLRKWTSERLEQLLKMPAEKEIVDNILSYDDPGDLSEFLGLFADDSAEHLVRQFVDDLFKRRTAGRSSIGAPPPPPPPPVTNGHAGSNSGGPQGRSKGDKGKGKGKQDRGKGNNEVGAASKSIANAFKMPTYGRLENDRRLMVIDAASGRHEVLTNCLNCGKVVVEEEGWGPCLFCGSPLEVGGRSIRRGDERGYVESSTTTAADEAKYNASFERAKATKDRLLDYDRNAKARTKVYDDSTDWYTEKDNQWLSQAQREDAVRQAKDEERRRYEEKRKIHAKIDLFGRTVISADAEMAEKEAEKNKENFRSWNDKVVEQNRLLNMMAQEEKGTGGKSQLSQDSQKLYDQLRASLHATGKSTTAAVSEKEPRKQTRWEVAANERVAGDFADLTAEDFSKGTAQLLPAEESPYGDAEDQGMVLSMHQPWASLLVAGFKRAEGRSWSTKHRGRLWIHAAGKEPDPDEIELLETKYRSIYEAQGVPVPSMPSKSSGYPTSVLLGCVDLETCWKQEDYRSVLKNNPTMPQEENDSDYIFWCLRPRRLIVPLRMGGDHHLWRLPQLSLGAAQRGLVPVRWPAPAAEGECTVNSPFVEEAEERRKAKVTAAASSSSSSSRAARGSGNPPPKAPPPMKGLPQKPPSLDLWPSDDAGERLEVAVKDRDLGDRDLVLLNGFVHLGGFVPGDIQQRIVDAVREVGISPDLGFYVEQFDGLKVSADTQRLYFGQHWNSVTQAYEPKRKGEQVPELPKLLVDMYLDAIKRANRVMTQGANKKRKLTPFIEDKKPTIAVANYFEPKGSMEMHQDKQESKAAVEAGYPVMGICLGDACELSYSMEAASDGKPKVVRLESGDVYLFGGPARLLWHGVQKVIPHTAPPSLRLLPGRLSVTLRVA